MNAISQNFKIQRQDYVSSIQTVEKGLDQQLSAVNELQSVLAELREEINKMETNFTNFGASIAA
ncbi:MAG: hypothetical protein HOB79_17845 [Rhodospirillaceae bacterium]|jgi:uncharacterized coiled-coil DUF342 family protein|nr:hypothetical protein [Rhodospirillales bacterium]MBT3904041.1 hypothetical protein [Rhodospirillaceae bacterium]MBT4702938.1 hypothetical protein [Rhodospirillaceae bacterium]MBT5036498.1 hypothetical protein [Rhodospirillaceae bacterium]MBT6219623.1 hypothetical protein [Rhodospirillaceae bacterium]